MLSVPLPVSSDELENDEEAQELLRQAEEKKRARLLTTPKKKMSRSRLSSPRKTPRKTPSKVIESHQDCLKLNYFRIHRLKKS